MNPYVYITFNIVRSGHDILNFLKIFEILFYPALQPSPAELPALRGAEHSRGDAR